MAATYVFKRHPLASGLRLTQRLPGFALYPGTTGRYVR